MDREEVLGSVSLPLAQIPSVAHRRRWMPLTAKNAQAMGDLCIDCWVLSFKKAGEGGKWNSLIPFGLRGATGTKDRSKRRTSIANASISKRGSRSIENLCTLPDLKADGESEKSGVELSPASSSSGTSLAPLTLFKPRLAPTLGQVLSSSRAPEITGLSPKSGPSSGGTRITVRGCNLGMSQEDIVSINLCGCDLLYTLEYHSPAKLVVVTEAWSGSGPVVLETKSGGRGVSTLNFTFQDKTGASAVSNTDKKGIKASKAELLTEITKLREEIDDLTVRNRTLKNYIDKLMIILMEKFPEILENLASSGH